MKRFWILFLIFIFFVAIICFMPTFNIPQKTNDGSLKYKFKENSKSISNYILYKYIYDYHSENGSIEMARNISLKDVLTIEFDLNGDGKKEIIGYINNSDFETRYGYPLEILEKKSKGYYVNISTALGLEKGSDIIISPEKTSGYRNIQFTCAGSKPHTCEIKYHNGLYKFNY